MASWLILLGGLLLWAGHFFALYAIGEFGGDGPVARWSVFLVTIVLFLADLVLLRWIARRSADGFARWRNHVGAAGALLAAIAILWQALPAILLEAG